MLRSVGLLLLRLVVGGTMMSHGYPKLFGGPGKKPPEQAARVLGPNWAPFVENSGPENFAAGLERMGLPYPLAGAYASGIAEFCGGMALALGLKTRLAALLIIGNLSIAIWKVHWQKGFFGEGGYEFPMSLATSAATLGLTGPGAISVDGICSKLRRCGKKGD
jgi:putative oxidoreductase